MKSQTQGDAINPVMIVESKGKHCGSWLEICCWTGDKRANIRHKLARGCYKTLMFKNCLYQVPAGNMCITSIKAKDRPLISSSPCDPEHGGNETLGSLSDCWAGIDSRVSPSTIRTSLQTPFIYLHIVRSPGRSLREWIGIACIQISSDGIFLR